MEEQPPPPYSAFGINEKRCIVALVAYAAWFSTTSSFIYYPAIPLLSKALGVSVDSINLTVTSYMAVAMFAPTLVGDAADQIGRRPVYVATLSLYAAVCIAIASTKSYNVLLGLRILQALAISGTFSIAYGVITDVASPAERGTFVSIVSFTITIAPSLGPILGGALSYAAGWPWIFWFLAITSGFCLILVVFLLPETSRTVVGNGSIAPPTISRLPIPIFSNTSPQDTETTGNLRLKIPNPLKSFRILLRKDNFTVITACGLLYVVYTCINASLSVIFVDMYGLTEWQAGFIYLPFGLGGVCSTFFSGPLLNRAYHRSRSRMGLPTDRAKGDDLDDFDVEKARLRLMWMPLIVNILGVVAFGWVLHYDQHIAIPLVIQFVLGLCMQLEFSIYNTLLVDKNHRHPAAAQAASNIIRCALAAIMVAFMEQTIQTFKVGWTFTFMGGLCILVAALFAVDFQFGARWRQQRLARKSSETAKTNNKSN